MLLFRVISSICLISLLLVSILSKSQFGFGLFMVFNIFLSFCAVREFLAMLRRLDKPSYPDATAFISVSIVCSLLIFNSMTITMCILMLTILGSWVTLLFSKNNPKVLDKLMNSVSALIFVMFPLSFIARLYGVGLDDGFYGRHLLLFLILTTKSGDIGAYVVGTFSSKVMPGGNHKIIPSISPKKSWEGTLGGLATSIICAYFLWPQLNLDHSIALIVLIGTILFIGGFAGDLTISTLKRITGAKDSGNIIPGMGGVLDVLDSLLLNAPIFCVFMSYLKGFQL